MKERTSFDVSDTYAKILKISSLEMPQIIASSISNICITKSISLPTEKNFYFALIQG
jgi:hypothetical protein